MQRVGEHGFGEAQEKEGRAWNYGLGLKLRVMKSEIYPKKHSEL
jgi:hypothetical protein